MKRGIIAAAGFAACTLSIQAAFAATPGGCAAASKALPTVAACVEAPTGVALADSPADAASLAEYGKAAEARFEKHFGRKPAPYALLTTSGEASLDPLKTLGYKATYRWATDAQHDETTLASIKANLDKMAAERGLSKEQVDQFYNESVDRHSKRMESGERNKMKGVLIPTQIARASLDQAFWPNGDTSGGKTAPDWLQEVAARVVEDDVMSGQRREQFKGGYKGDGADPMTFLLSSGQLTDLTSFLTKPSPLPNRSAGSPGGSMMMVARGNGGPPSPMAEGIAYSLKARMFADYLIERTGQAGVFGNIAAAVAQNQTIEQWLGGEGKTLGLPGDLAGLEADWKAWLLKKFGKPA